MIRYRSTLLVAVTAIWAALKVDLVELLTKTSAAKTETSLLATKFTKLAWTATLALVDASATSLRAETTIEPPVDMTSMSLLALILVS